MSHLDRLRRLLQAAVKCRPLPVWSASGLRNSSADLNDLALVEADGSVSRTTPLRGNSGRIVAVTERNSSFLGCATGCRLELPHDLIFVQCGRGLRCTPDEQVAFARAASFVTNRSNCCLIQLTQIHGSNRLFETALSLPVRYIASVPATRRIHGNRGNQQP